MSEKYIIQTATSEPAEQFTEVPVVDATIRGPEHAKRYCANHKMTGKFRVLRVCEEFEITNRPKTVDSFEVV